MSRLSQRAEIFHINNVKSMVDDDMAAPATRASSTMVSAYSVYFGLSTRKINAWWRHQMETFFRVTGHLRGELTGHRWIPNTKTSDTGLLTFSLICVRINGWVNNGEAGDLRRHRAHYDVIVMNKHIWYRESWGGMHQLHRDVSAKEIWNGAALSQVNNSLPSDTFIS